MTSMWSLTSTFWILLGICSPSIAFSTLAVGGTATTTATTAIRRHQVQKTFVATSATRSSAIGTTTPSAFLYGLRGGADGSGASATEEAVTDEIEAIEAEVIDPPAIQSPDTVQPPKPAPTNMVLAPLFSLGQVYAQQLQVRPMMTKSVTAGLIFTLSDWLAQQLEKDKDKPTRTNWTRSISSGLVGLLYFGPAAHLWYEAIFALLPGTTLFSTLQKATLGQLIFGPSFTCVFFGVSLLQSNQFTLGNWFRKIKSDLPGAWAAGLGFWPLVDLISYSSVPKDYIPLFINSCSLVWTIYLSMVANKQTSPSKKGKGGKK